MLPFFVFLLKMITTNDYNTQKLCLGSLQDKKSRDGEKYQNIPILYDGRKAIVRLCGRFDLRHSAVSVADVQTLSVPVDDDDVVSVAVTVSAAVEVDADNKKLFEDFEKKLQSLVGSELKLIKYDDRVYLKIYLNKGKMVPKFWKVFEKNGTEHKKAILDKESLIGKNIEGEIVFSFANIFVGGEGRRGKTQKSIICVAKEILVKEVMTEMSYFREYPVGEDDEALDEHTPHLF